jgi:para-nitrobenzyl esterase
MGKRIMTSKGLMEGVDYEGYSVYKGVPYAKPPVGELRWKAPQKMDSWEGVLRADQFGKITEQDLPDSSHPIVGRFHKEFYADPAYIPAMSEDCLYLNIWAPDHKEGEKLPVAFWLHGGGFGGGYSSEMEFDGEAYCKKGVILVTVEYRCNVYGFLAHPWLDNENEKGISGNYGILDQVAALHWVYENISSFGGDPSNITVFGQSAGSMSTQTLVSSALTEGKIAKAIMQSGIFCKEGFGSTPTLAEAEEYGRIFVEECAGVKSIEQLRALTTKQINEARRTFEARMWQQGAGIVLVPNVDGYLLKKDVKEIWNDGAMRQIPYMAGTVIDDLLTKPDEVKEKKTGALMEQCKLWSLKCESVYGAPAYLYFFAHELPGDDWGAFHSSELWYTFKTLGRCWRPVTDADYKLSEDMVTYWTNFMKTGKPAGEGTKAWEPYRKENQFIRKFE